MKMKINFSISNLENAFPALSNSYKSFVQSFTSFDISTKIKNLEEELESEIFNYMYKKERKGTKLSFLEILRRENLLPNKIDEILCAIKSRLSCEEDIVEKEISIINNLFNVVILWFSSISTNEDGTLSKSLITNRGLSNDEIDGYINEKETRFLIDASLRSVGWNVNTVLFRYGSGTRPASGKNLAIAEWPTDSKKGNGHADYVLFKGLDLVAIIEAKKFEKDIPSELDYQGKDYAKNIKEEHARYVNRYKKGKYSVPFIFATNGRKYNKNLETKSGIWFQDLRDERNIPMAINGWISPVGFKNKLRLNTREADEELSSLPISILTDSSGLALRDYQVEAVKETVKAIKEGKRKMLLAMATGTGKTRVVLALIYCFALSKRFRHVLYLVDRNTLGKQVCDSISTIKIQELMTLNNLYNVRLFNTGELDGNFSIDIATVQSLVRSVIFKDGEDKSRVSDYDLIVVDEAHRGYILDREMSDEDVEWESESDYLSKYKRVIEYFDAVKIALTATPALHTITIFGDPIYTYSYRDAVLDGYLVDHDAPIVVKTKLLESGIKYKKGDKIKLINPRTSDEKEKILEDEITFDVDTFNRQVITENFNRTSLEAIAWDLIPFDEDERKKSKGKTLIYAVNDSHADLIVKILREIYSEGGVNSDAVLKITGSSAGGVREKIEDAIKRFKNEEYPKVVVTVDLLTTGVDIPPITNIVFLRRVKSRILFEQMLGRATRLCPEIEKTSFKIYDLVGTYEILEDYTTMKPTVVNVSLSFSDILKKLSLPLNEDEVKSHLDTLIVKIRRMRNSFSKATVTYFRDLTGFTPDEYATYLRKKKDAMEARDEVLKNEEAFLLLDKNENDRAKSIVLSTHPDEVVEIKRGYGKNGVKPEDYIEFFKEFIKENVNKIEALNIVCTRPKDLSTKDLRSLKRELDKNDFTEGQLNSALNELTNEDIVRDIITIVRGEALGIVPADHNKLVRNAFEKLKNNHSFTPKELVWLERIENTMLKNDLLNKEMFNEGAYKSSGGFNNINNKDFSGKLEEYIDELKDYLYENGGNAS